MIVEDNEKNEQSINSIKLNKEIICETLRDLNINNLYE
jgi:hypothetical protein